jgi:CBS domain-containing protein
MTILSGLKLQRRDLVNLFYGLDRDFIKLLRSKSEIESVMMDCVKARLNEAKSRLKKNDNGAAFRLAYEALDMFLRELCFKCGARLDPKQKKGSVSKWGFARCVDFLMSHSMITKTQGSTLFRINNLRVSIVHYGKNPDETETKEVIREISRFIRGRGICACAIMNKPVVSVDASDPISKAREIMIQHDYSQLPVFRENKAVGSVSEKTFVKLFPTLELATELTVDKVMEDPILRCATPRIK